MFHFKSHFDYPAGKPMSPRLLRCQWFRVGDYTFAIGRLEAGATSTFAQLGFQYNEQFNFELLISDNEKQLAPD